MTTATYTYAQVADRIEATLGTRPALSTLRTAATRDHTVSSNDARVRITTGMPAPLPGPSRQQAHFAVEEIEAWLSNHPRRRREMTRQTLERLVRDENTTEAYAVAFARSEGLSWGEIAKVLSRVRDVPVARSTLHATYRHLPTPPRD